MKKKTSTEEKNHHRSLARSLASRGTPPLLPSPMPPSGPTLPVNLQSKPIYGTLVHRKPVYGIPNTGTSLNVKARPVPDKNSVDLHPAGPTLRVSLQNKPKYGTSAYSTPVHGIPDISSNDEAGPARDKISIDLQPALPVAQQAVVVEFEVALAADVGADRV